MQKHLYVILVHRNPHQVARLIDRLNHEQVSFIVHVDLRIDITPFRSEIEKVKNADVIFLDERYAGSWGGLGIVEATISALKFIENRSEQYATVSLISGQDYPIKANEKIVKFLNNVQGNYMTYEPFPCAHLNYGGLNRIEFYSIDFRGVRETYIPMSKPNSLNIKGKLLNAFLGVSLIFKGKRTFPEYLKPYYGSQWWTLNKEGVTEILYYINKHPDYHMYHKYSILPDEMYFQSIMLQIITENPGIHIINDNLRYIDWSEKGNSPKTLKIDDYERLKHSPQLFARKFDEIEHSDIMNLIDQEILGIM